MNDHQRYLFKMLCEIDDICTEHGIRYFLHGGTLLGAVRNEGFLPWDDDIDIAMPYDDFARFVDACKTSVPDNRVLRTPTLDPKYCRVMPRYTSTETTAIRITSSLHHDIAGETIDIFVLDPIADGAEAFNQYRKDLFLYHSAISYADANGTRVETDPQAYLEMTELAKQKGQTYASEALEKRLASSFSESGENYAIRWRGFQGPASRSWFASSKPMVFEGREFQAPCNSYAYLCLLFGEEWWQVPKKMNPSKHSIAFSLAFPYTEALEYFQPRYDWEQLRADCEGRKLQRFVDAKEANSMRDGHLITKASALSINLKKHIALHRDDFDAALASRDAERLSQILDWYLEYQSSKSYIGRPVNAANYRYYRPVLIPAEADVFDGALIALFATSRVSSARRLLEIARTQGREDTPASAEIDQAIEDFRSCMFAYELKDFERGLALASDLTKRYPSSSEFSMLACAHMKALCEQDPSAENLARLSKMAQEGAERFPAEGCFIMLQADIMRANGKSNEETLPLYLQAAENTDNGFALHAIAKQCGYHPIRIRKHEWAKAAHVPQWDGMPAPPLEIEQDSSKNPEPSPVALYLFDLLCEAVDLLEKHGVGYVVSPALAKAFAADHMIPGKMEDYALLCDHEKLPSLLQASIPANRALTYMGNDRSMKSRAVRYHGLDSFHLAPQKAADVQPGLFVSIIPLEPEHYPKQIEREIEQWNASPDNFFKAKNRLAMRFAPSRRASVNRTKAGRQLFSRTAGCPSPNRRAVRYAKKTLTLPSSLIENSSSLSFRGHDFRIPSHVEEYAEVVVDSAYIAPTVSPTDIFLPGHDLDWFIRNGYYDPKHPAEWSALMKKYTKGHAAFKRFHVNFEQVKLAVRVKEQALVLLPRKGEILELREQGDRQALEPILAPYAKIVEKDEKLGNVCFDQEILEAAHWLIGKQG